MVVEDVITLPFHPWGGQLGKYYCSGGPLQISEQYPLLYPRLLPDPCPQPVCGQLVAHHSPQFSGVLSIWWRGFKIINCKVFGSTWTHSLPCSITALNPAPFCPGKKNSCTPAPVPRVYGEAQQRASTRLSALCVHLCPLLLNCCSIPPRGSFVLREERYPLPNAL